MLIKIYNVLRKISGVLMAFSGAFLIGATLFTSVSVIMRYCMKAPILGSTEIMEILMAVMVFAALAFTQTEKGHIHVMMLVNLFPKKVQQVIFALHSILSTVCSAAVTYGMYLQGGYALRKHLVSTMLYIPYYPFYYFACLAMAVFTIVLLIDACIAVAAVFSRRYGAYMDEQM